MDTRKRDRARNLIGGCKVSETIRSDCLAVVLCCYFEDHDDRPIDDPEDECGWGEWVKARANEAADLIAKQTKVIDAIPDP